MTSSDLILTLKAEKSLPKAEMLDLLEMCDSDELFSVADEVRRQNYGDAVYIRGLIEFSNYCKNDCYYCGIRRSNKNCTRYRLEKDDILAVCREGYDLGFRTFVLQGGEDVYYTVEKMCDIVYSIKSLYPDCAVTLSAGEKNADEYRAYFSAGANRYLLRHETADAIHYSKLHPEKMSSENRKSCLYNLKSIGFQVGAGFMVGSPYQTHENIISDLDFLSDLQPDMIGIGPFLSHKDTPFATFANGSFELTLKLVAILRLMFPYALIPSTTALETINPNGREMGLRAGANVLMPNLSPQSVRRLYMLYDNKISTGDEAAQNLRDLEKRVSSAGYKIVTDVGNVKPHS